MLLSICLPTPPPPLSVFCKSVYKPVFLSVCPSIFYLSACLSVCLPVTLAVYLSACLFVCLPVICPTVSRYLYRSVCLPVFLSVCLPFKHIYRQNPHLSVTPAHIQTALPPPPPHRIPPIIVSVFKVFSLTGRCDERSSITILDSFPSLVN